MLDVGLGCGFAWFGGWFVPFSLDFFFFFLRWRWWMCGSGCWWPLLQHSGWAIVGDDSDRDREEVIYYFNL